MIVRDTVPERDAGAIVALVRESQPFAVITADAWLHRSLTVPEEAALHSWVAEENGMVIANAFAFRNFFGSETTAIVGVTVREAERRRGIGARLWERVLEHVRALGSTTIMATFDENDGGVAFAAERGFHETRAETHSVLDPATVDDAPPADVLLVSLADADPRDAYEVDMAATRDMPMTEPMPDMTYDEWARHVIDHPLFTRDGSFVAYVEGRAAGVSLLLSDGDGRATSMMTGTLEAYRGRGLARAVKLASIAWAREHGVHTLSTENDERNAPMLALNRRLGYVPAGRRVEYVCQRSAGSGSSL